MKTIIITLALILGLAIGSLAGHYHGVAVTLQSVLQATQAQMEDLK